MITESKQLERIFNPQTVVVVGDSKRGNFHWLHNEQTFKGKVYSVQVSQESIDGIRELGVKNYTSLLEVPQPVDLVIVNAPRSSAVSILNDCINKGVGAVHFFTAGFAETGTREGIELELELKRMAERANMPVIGPNCRGIFNPSLGLRQISEQYSGFSGHVGLIMQSGGHAMYFSREAHFQGIDINKSVSFGNGLTLNESDFLEYFGTDAEIRVIGMYLEGVKDGRRFYSVLKDVATRKPVVIWKGGWTDDGGRAIAAHTASLAVSQSVWEGMLRQCGAISVTGLEDMIDTIKALLFLPQFTGNRVAVVGGAGGQSIEMTDVLGSFGLKVPPLSHKSYEELGTFFSLIGGSFRNPLDTDTGYNRRSLTRILKILANDNEIDIILLRSRTGTFMFSQQLREIDIEAASNVKKETFKPLLVILPYATPEEMAEAYEVIPRFQKEGIPVFPSVERAAIAMRNVLDYYRKRRDRKLK